MRWHELVYWEGWLEGTLAATGDGPLNSEGEQARQKLEENITIARLALKSIVK